MQPPNTPEFAIYALTSTGARLGRRLADALKGRLFVPQRFAAAYDGVGFDSLGRQVGQTFRLYRGHIFIAATGIVVRLLSPLLTNKATDPAVVVLDQAGRFAISLVGGHLAGANDLAATVAAFTGGQAVVTTATDTAGLVAIDVLARRAGLVVADPGRIKNLNAALLEGERVRVEDPEDWLGLAGAGLEAYYERASADEAATALLARVECFEAGLRPDDGALLLHPPCLCLGIGCRRGIAAADVEEFVRRFFAEQGLALASLWRLGSIEAKRDEAGLVEAAQRLGRELVFFSAGRLNRVVVPHPSAKAAAAVGTASVCEAAALLLARTETLMRGKTVWNGITLALARRVRCLQADVAHCSE